MLNSIEIRVFYRQVDKTNVVDCHQVLSVPGCMTRGIVMHQSHTRLGVNYFENVINYLQFHWKLFN